MAWSGKFSTKNFVKNFVLVGVTKPLFPKPLRFDLWVRPSADGMNMPLFVYDSESTTWQRDLKVIVSATDPGADAAHVLANDIRANDLWVTPGVGSGSVVKVWSGTAWQ